MKYLSEKNVHSLMLVPALNKLHKSLESNYEEFLRKEILFVQQCYLNGMKSWWRKFFHIGLRMPDDAEIRKWIITKTGPSIIRGFNPRVLELAIKHYESKNMPQIESDLMHVKLMLIKATWLNEDEISYRYPVMGVAEEIKERYPELEKAVNTCLVENQNNSTGVAIKIT